MSKKSDHKLVYFFSDKLRKKLEQIPYHPLTIVEAPSGFGKTTAIREYLKLKLPQNACEYWYTCLGESACMAWMGICELFANINARAADDLKNLKMPTIDTLLYVAAYLRDIYCQTETYLVIDNFQLVKSDIPRELMSVFSMHGDPKLHIIFMTQQLEAKQQMSIYNGIHTIDTSYFFFDRKATASLFRKEGIRLTQSELEEVYTSTEGWVSAIRLHIINYKENGFFSRITDVERLVETAIWNRLGPKEKDFLLSVSILDSFTARQAAIMLNQEILPEEIEKLLKTNDFIRYLPDIQLYSIHSIVQDYLRTRFYSQQSKEYQNSVLYKAGQSYAANAQYITAAKFYYMVRDFDAILSLPFSGQYFHNQQDESQAEFIKSVVDESPNETLCKYPFTMLVFAYEMLTWGQIEIYQKLCWLLQLTIQNGTGLDQEELRRIKGEYTFLESVGDYNDITKAIQGGLAAWDILGMPSEIIKNDIPFLFASTSILNLFWRESGDLENELKQMDEFAPVYRRLTQNHGAGYNSVMRAEAMLMRGEDNQAEILCHKALYDARSNQQVGICLCAELVLARIAILRGDVEGYLTAIKNIQGHVKGNSKLYVLRMAEQCMASIDLVLDIKDNVAPWIHDLESIQRAVYAPVVPFTQIHYLKLLLKEKKYNEFYGISQLIMDKTKNSTGNIKCMMPQIYHHKYLAIAKLQNGNQRDAQKNLIKALEIALPDKIYLPIAQSMSDLDLLLESALSSVSDKEGLNALIRLGRRQEKGAAIIRKAILSDRSLLTPREREIALLARKRLSAKEIAAKLYISDATVRTILKNVYRKLNIHSKYELNSKVL